MTSRTISGLESDTSNAGFSDFNQTSEEQFEIRGRIFWSIYDEVKLISMEQ